jgi:lipoprotein-anchoring transpeptidase ErfK/SrfK
MWNSRILAVCFAIISGSASAQECPPFFLLCPRPIEPRYQPPPPPVEPREPARSYDPRGYEPPGYEPRGYDQRAYEPRGYDPRDPRDPRVSRSYEPGYERQRSGMYGPVAGEPFPVPAVPLSEVDPNYLRREVAYPSNEPPGTIIIDPQSRFLYLVQGGGRAMRYGVGVGREGFGWSGVATIRDKQAWPDWYPPKEMVQRQPELRRQLSQLRSGLGVAGGPGNPLGARAMYLWQGNKDTLFRIHGTNEPETIGRSVSSGCIRMLNQDVIDLYQRTPVGAKVVVLRSRVS